jgi:hypothetical protein
MIDETDPVVRAIQAPFETNMGQFYRQVNDANAVYHEEADKIEAESAKLDEEREEILSGRKKDGEQEKKPAKQAQEFDYDSPLAAGQQEEERRWPGTPQQAEPAQPHQESTSDDGDPWEGGQRRRLRATWTQPEPEQEPTPPPWSAPPPPPRRAPRRAARDDEDYSNESWMQ